MQSQIFKNTDCFEKMIKIGISYSISFQSFSPARPNRQSWSINWQYHRNETGKIRFTFNVITLFTRFTWKHRHHKSLSPMNLLRAIWKRQWTAGPIIIHADLFVKIWEESCSSVDEEGFCYICLKKGHFQSMHLFFLL